jgi:hypothetical protein
VPTVQLENRTSCLAIETRDGSLGREMLFYNRVCGRIFSISSIAYMVIIFLPTFELHKKEDPSYHTRYVTVESVDVILAQTSCWNICIT